MNTTTKIKFDPSLFGEEQTSAMAEQPSMRVKKESRRWPIAVLAFGLVGAIGGAIAISNASRVPGEASYRIGSAAARSDSSIRRIAIDPDAQPNTLPVMQAYSTLDRWCDGNETICTTTTTATPASTLQKLIAAIPQGKAKEYKIRLSVTPIQDVEIDDVAK